MSTGSSEDWSVYEEESSGTVDQACLWSTDLFESSTAASSPCHSAFEADRPNWVYQWKTLKNRWRPSTVILNWEPVAHLHPIPFPCLQSLIQKLSARRPEGERKQKTCCAVGIAQIERKLSVVSEGLIGTTLANLRSRSIEDVQEIAIRKFTSSQYKGVRPSIVD